MFRMPIEPLHACGNGRRIRFESAAYEARTVGCALCRHVISEKQQ